MSSKRGQQGAALESEDGAQTGGEAMRGTISTTSQALASGIIRVAITIAMSLAVTGLWAYLWVGTPPVT